MPRKLAVDELHKRTDTILVAIQAGECLTLTSDGKPVADVVPHGTRRSPWVPAAELRRIRREAPADHRLLGDLGDVRAGLIGTG